MVFSGKGGGGVSVVANRVKRGGGVGCRKLIAN